MKQVYAPWLPQEVCSLNQYQQSGDFHPFTGESKPNGKETILIATEAGWVEEEGGPVVQDWAYEFMTQYERTTLPPDDPNAKRIAFEFPEEKLGSAIFVPKR